METTTIDLSVYTKDVLVEIYAAATGSAGDYARRSKAFYRDALNEMEPSVVAKAVQHLYDTGILTEADDEPSTEQESLPLPTPTAPTARPATDDLTAAAELLRIIAANKGIDENAVRAIVTAELAKTEPTRIEHVVIERGEARKIDGHLHKSFDRVFKLAQIRQNILIVGAAGCGKTKLAHQVADALGLPFGMTSCSAGMSENQLTGWLLPVEAGGKFSYVPAGFAKAYEHGGVFLLDEIDAADENTLLVINAALANGHMHIAQRHESPVVKRHPDFVCIAAANTFGHGADMMYAGRNKLDGATLDRFRAGIVKMDYDEVLETSLVDPVVYVWAKRIRDQINDLRLRRVMSTRVMLDFTAQKDALGFTVKDFEESYFADWTRDELSKIGR